MPVGSLQDLQAAWKRCQDEGRDVTVTLKQGDGLNEEDLFTPVQTWLEKHAPAGDNVRLQISGHSFGSAYAALGAVHAGSTEARERAAGLAGAHDDALERLREEKHLA